MKVRYATPFLVTFAMLCRVALGPNGVIELRKVLLQRPRHFERQSPKTC
jgi:hypothetical protein